MTLRTRLAALSVQSLAMAALVTSVATTRAQVSERTDFGDLIALAAERLQISRQVALTKWDTQDPVADPPGDPREQAVIDDAAAEALRMGLPANTASAFFADQIEASKLTQYALMAKWSRAGIAPTGDRVDLKTGLRPALDILRPRFVEALLATRLLRTRSGCSSQLANETAAFVQARRMGPLDALALDRGLARVCGGK